MKKTNNYWMAVLVFVLTMVLLYGGTLFISLVAAVGGAVMGGDRALDLVERFIMENQNLLSCLIYIVPGAVFLTWYYFAFVEKRGVRQTLASHTRRLTPACFGWVVLLGFAVQHVISLIMALIYVLLPSAMDQYTEMIDSSGITEYSILWAVATLILPPIVEETIFRIARAYGVESSDAFVLSSGIFLTAGSEREQDFARVRHIPLSAARLDKVTAVNQLSREIEEGRHTPAEARKRLLEIQHMPPKPKSHQVLASGVGSACFCFLFGGDVVDSAAAFAAGILLYLYLLYLVRGRLSKIAANLSGGALVTLFGILLYQCGIGHHLGEMIIGSIIPLVPGVAFTTAIRDIADEDYIAGAVRMLDALLVTFCIAMGVGLVIMAWHHFAGGTLL